MNDKFSVLEFWANPYNLEKLLNSSEKHTHYFFGGLIRVKNREIKHICYIDDIPFFILINPNLYHIEGDKFDKYLKENNFFIKNIKYKHNNKAEYILDKFALMNSPKERYEKIHKLLKIKKKPYIKKIITAFLSLVINFRFR